MDSKRMRALSYGLITIFSIAVFGSFSEQCDEAGHCSSRFVTVIVFGVLTFIVAIVLFFTVMLGVIEEIIEFFLSIAQLALCSVLVSVITSPRTVQLMQPAAVTLAWGSEILSFTCFFLLLVGGVGRDSRESNAANAEDGTIEATVPLQRGERAKTQPQTEIKSTSIDIASPISPVVSVDERPASAEV